MKYTFILYVFDVVDINMFLSIHSQTLRGLTLTKTKMRYILAKWVYYITLFDVV